MIQVGCSNPHRELVRIAGCTSPPGNIGPIRLMFISFDSVLLLDFLLLWDTEVAWVALLYSFIPLLCFLLVLSSSSSWSLSYSTPDASSSFSQYTITSLATCALYLRSMRGNVLSRLRLISPDCNYWVSIIAGFTKGQHWAIYKYNIKSKHSYWFLLHMSLSLLSDYSFCKIVRFLSLNGCATTDKCAVK